jgi:HEAT repeat protein
VLNQVECEGGASPSLDPPYLTAGRRRIVKAATSNALIVLVVSLLVPVPVQAQPLFARADSLEATVANADLVLIGTVEKYKERPSEDGGVKLFDATIVVEEELKQPVFEDGYTKVSITIPRPEADLACWQDRQSRLMLALDYDRPGETTVIELERDRLKTLSADFTLLRDPDEAIRIARDTVQRTPVGVKRVQTFGLRVPRDVIAGTEWEDYYETSGHLVLMVPVDERLEVRAIERLRSKDYSTRHEAARALRYFKSDENINRMKDLLDDPGWGYLRHAQENDGVEVRHYGVRNQAYEALQAWGVDVPEPEIREEVR